MGGLIIDNVQWRSFPLLSGWGMFMISDEVTEEFAASFQCFSCVVVAQFGEFFLDFLYVSFCV